MAKILYCGDCAVQTGFGRVAEGLLPVIAQQHEVVVMAVNYWGDPHDLPYVTKKIQSFVSKSA